MRLVKAITCLLLLTGCWLWSLSTPCFGASLMVEKNLFAPDRKPPSAEATAPASQGNKPGLTAKAVQLDGVFIQGDIKKAIMRLKGQLPGADKAKPQNPYVTVREGEKIGDLHVVKIDFRSVSVEKDGQVEVVNLFAGGKVVPPPPPVPATPSASAPPPGQAAPGSEAPKGQAQPGGQAAQAPSQHPAAGARMPGVARAPGAPNAPGGQRGLMPPGQMEPQEDEGVPEEEGGGDEGGDEAGS